MRIHNFVSSTPLPAAQRPLSAEGALPAWRSPWDQAVEAAAQNTELGEAFDPGTRKKLEQALVELERAGVKFSRDESRLFASGRRVALSARQVVGHLAQCRAHYLDKLYVEVPGHPEFEPQHFRQLAATAQFVSGPPDLLKAALEGLGEVGFDKDSLASYAQAFGSDALDIQFYRGGHRDRFTGNLETYCTRGLDEILAVNCLSGNGSFDGLERPDRARRLKAAVEAGWIDRQGAVQAYQAEGERIPLEVAEGLPPMMVREGKLDDVPATARLGTEYAAAYRKYILPVARTAGYGASASFHEELHTPDGRLPLEARMESFAILATARKDSPQVHGEVQALHHELVSTSPGALELMRGAELLVPPVREGDFEKARQTLKDLAQMPRDPKAELYGELREATGSHSVARAGVNLVRIPSYCEPIGRESLEVRKQAYVRLANALPHSAREQAPDVYQELLIHRHPAEPLEQACNRLCALVAGCAATGFPMLAPALYEMLQDGPPEKVDARIRQFGQACALSGSLSDALQALDPQVAQTIEVEPDRVRIGGVVLRRRASG